MEKKTVLFVDDDERLLASLARVVVDEPSPDERDVLMCLPALSTYSTRIGAGSCGSMGKPNSSSEKTSPLPQDDRER
jgi:hypothetical protein